MNLKEDFKGYQEGRLTQVQGGISQAVSLVGVGAVAQQQLH